jgi:hypothetical protein
MPKNTQYDLESEQAVLSAMMITPAIYKQVDLSIEDFYDKNHRKIYQCICELNEEGIESDYVTVFSKIKFKGWDAEIQDVFLSGLCTDIPTSVSRQWKSYVAVIKKKSAARELKLLAQNLEKVSQNGLDDLSGKIDVVISQLGEIRDKAANKGRSIAEQVRDWVLTTSGNFLTTECHAELGLTTRDHKKAAVMALLRLEEEGIVAKCGIKRGCYRAIEKDAPLIDFINVNLNEPYHIKWPFQVENYVDLYPGNVVVVAGEANAGKTALLLNVVRRNMHRHKIEYFSSEMGSEEFHLRLAKFDDIKLNEWCFSPRQRSIKFADVIVPDSLNIIDYLEITKDFFEIGGEIKDIFDRLNKGIAIIALQKKKGTDIGRGGDFTLEKPRLYMSMQPGELKIIKGKNWANPQINPNNMTWKFKLVQGCKFIESGGTAYDLY